MVGFAILSVWITTLAIVVVRIVNSHLTNKRNNVPRDLESDHAVLLDTTTKVVSLNVLSLLLVSGYGYIGLPSSFILSSQIADGWCNLPGQGLGDHCFGDFGLPYSEQVFGYDGGSEYASSITPLVLVFFRILSLLSYNEALFLYLVILATCCVIPWLWLCRAKLVAVAAGLSSIGAIVALDRGNHVPLASGLFSIYWVSATASTSQFNRKLSDFAVLLPPLALALAASQKFWTVLFLVVPLLLGRIRHFFLGLAYFLALNLTALAVLSASPWLALRQTQKMMLDADYASYVSKYAVSLPSFIGRLICFGDGGCLANNPSHNFRISPVVALALLAFLALLTILLRRIEFALNRSQGSLAIAVFLLWGVLGLPEAAAYNLVLFPMIALVALTGRVFYEPASDVSSEVIPTCAEKREDPLHLERMLFSAACLFSLVPLPLWWFVDGDAGMSFVGHYLGYFRAPSLIVPILWTTVLVVLSLSVVRWTTRGLSSN